MGEYLLIALRQWRWVPRGVSNIYKGFHRSLSNGILDNEKRRGRKEGAELLSSMTCHSDAFGRHILSFDIAFLLVNNFVDLWLAQP